MRRYTKGWETWSYGLAEIISLFNLCMNGKEGMLKNQRTPFQRSSILRASQVRHEDLLWDIWQARYSAHKDSPPPSTLLSSSFLLPFTISNPLSIPSTFSPSYTNCPFAFRFLSPPLPVFHFLLLFSKLAARSPRPSQGNIRDLPPFRLQSTHPLRPAPPRLLPRGLLEIRPSCCRPLVQRLPQDQGCLPVPILRDQMEFLSRCSRWKMGYLQ